MHLETLLQKMLDEQKNTNELLTQLVSGSVPTPRIPQTPKEVAAVSEATVALDVPAPPPVVEPQVTPITQETPPPAPSRDIKTTSALVSLREKLMHAQQEMANPMLGLTYLQSVGAASYEQLTDPQITQLMQKCEIEVAQYRANGGGVA